MMADEQDSSALPRGLPGDPFDYHNHAEHGQHTIPIHGDERDLRRVGSGTPFMGYGQPQENPGWGSESAVKDVVQGLYIGIFAMFGALVRMMTAQFFGEECANPGTVGWLASGSPLCVTDSGGATEQGGIVFADLPANMLGSFIMGLFASCTALKLATSSHMNIAWVRPTSPFQKMPILHKAITTGFCGALTTFSGWNSAMVVLLFGTGSTRTTHVLNAVFGYIIGMEVAIGCFVAGKSLARRLYRSVNPILARESDAMMERQKEGVYLNRDLPDFERRFLPDLDMGRDGEQDRGHTVPISRLDYLMQWRESTKQVRRVNHPLLAALITIENAILVDHPRSPVPLEAESVAHAHGWNIAALREWERTKSIERQGSLPSVTSSNGAGENPKVNYIHYQPPPRSRDFPLFALGFSASAGGLIMGTLFVLLFMFDTADTYTITNRTMVYSMIWAPFGAVLRWELSACNSAVTNPGWSWFPLGTFMANLIGSVLSIAAIALEYKIHPSDTSFWLFGTVRAIKTGFVGSLTTVSTFVSEIHGFIVDHTDHAYPYMLTTIGCCCGASSLVYAIMVYWF